MSSMNQAQFALANGIVELSCDEAGLVDGGAALGSVSSDAVFGAGVAIIIAGAGNPVSDFVGGFMIGYAIA